MSIEKKIIEGLLDSEQFIRKAGPYLDPSYFTDKEDNVLVNIILDFFKKYNKIPSIKIVKLNVSELQLSDETFDSIEKFLDNIEPVDNLDWLLDKTEKFCLDKSIYNGILESLSIIEGTSKQYTQEAIPGILQKALSVSFDPQVGHSYFDDAETRFLDYTREENKLPFDIKLLNTITDGGLPNKSLSVILAACVHPDTKAKIRTNDFIEKEISIGEISTLIHEYAIEVESPDGWVPVTQFVNKGFSQEYLLTVGEKTLRCSSRHLVETDEGWKYAEDILNKNVKVLTESGWEDCITVMTGKTIPIVDITVDHENHRYYTNGISSHNSGVGKSLVMCHFASSYIRRGKNVLYITMEMAEEKIAERIDANLMNVDIQEIKKLSSDIYSTKIKNIEAKNHGKLFIKEYPTGAAHSGHFRALIEELKAKKGFKPDVLLVDYLGITASARVKMSGSINSYQYLKNVAEELRGLGFEYDIPVITAGQVNRSAFGASDFELSEIAESAAIVHTADLMMGIIRTEELDTLNQVMFKTLKNRYGDVGNHRRFVVGIDRAKMKLYDLERSAQQNIVPDVVKKPATDYLKREEGTRTTGRKDFSTFKF